jgi:hypothetical protein
MFRRVAIVRTDGSEESIASIIRVIRIGELITTLTVTSSVLWLLVTVNVVASSPILAGDSFLRNVGFNKSHKVLHPRGRHYFY